MRKYKDRHVLAEGYPYDYGRDQKTKKMIAVAMYKTIEGIDFLTMNIPVSLLTEADIPKWRLVLEKVK